MCTRNSFIITAAHLFCKSMQANCTSPLCQSTSLQFNTWTHWTNVLLLLCTWDPEESLYVIVAQGHAILSIKSWPLLSVPYTSRSNGSAESPHGFITSMVAVVHPLQKHSESTAKLFGVRSLTAASPNLHLLARRRDSTWLQMTSQRLSSLFKGIKGTFKAQDKPSTSHSSQPIAHK